MPYFETESLRYYFRQMGTGKDLILLHGFTGQTANWDGIKEQLATEFRLLMIDLPGHGQTDSPDDVTLYSMENVARDVWDLIEYLELENPILYGYSMGGRLALYMAIHYVFSKLILESSSPGLATEAERDERKRRDDALADRIEREGIEKFVDFWQGISLFESQKSLPDSIRAHQRQLRLKNTPRGLANSLRGMGTGVQPSLWSQLSNLEMPVLLMTGELDSKFVNITRQMHSALPHSILEIIPDAGHTIHLEQPNELVNIVRRFCLT